MASTRTLAAYLADEPEQKLAIMRDSIRQRREELADEDAELQVEERLVENALARKARRTGSPGGGRVTREQVFEIVTGVVPLQFRPADAIKAMKAAGYTLSDESVRMHLRRLAADGRLRRDGEFYFNPRPTQSFFEENGGGPAQASPDAVVAAEGKDREIRTADSPQGAG